MKAVMISIQPKWCELIASGEKTIEVRKTRPNIETPFKCYIYCTKSKPEIKIRLADFILDIFTPIEQLKANGKVIGEFICNKVEEFTVGTLACDDIEKAACLTYTQMIDYFYKPNELDGNTAKFGYAWHISDLKIYDEPKELGDFHKAFKYDKEGFMDCTKKSNVICKSKQDRCKYSDCEILQQLYPKITKPPQSWCYCEELEEKNNGKSN